MTLSASSLEPQEVERYRRELTGYCYRMLGSGSEAEDAVQDTMVRAWKAADGFEGRSSVRSWLYRIATNVCLDMLRGRERRARPMELASSSPPEAEYLGGMLPEHAWVSPIADERVLPDEADPADIAASRETIRLAFVTALQHLPARQRAVLILCQVLRWQATETAELLGTSVPAVNSALQRARATLVDLHPDEARPDAVGADQRALLARYVDAFERYDVDTLVTLLRDDAVQSMPPYAMWIQGATNIGRWLLGPGKECDGRRASATRLTRSASSSPSRIMHHAVGSRLLPVAANGCAAFGQYRPDGAGGHKPWALQVIEVSGDQISGFHSFLDTGHLFPAFGLPSELPA